MSARRRFVITLALAWACGFAPLLRAQGTGKRKRVGIVWASSHRGVLGLILQALHQLGWSEGQNVEYLERIVETSASLEGLLRELGDARLDVLLADDFAVAAAMKALPSIPIVCVNMVDPIGEGFTKSFARPDRNVTGISWQSFDSTSKRLQLTRELVPGLRRAAVLFDASDPSARTDARHIASSAEKMEISTALVELKDAGTVAAAFEQVKRNKPQVLIVSASPLTYQVRAEVIREATSAGLPIVSEIPPYAVDGGVLTYGPDVEDTNRRGAYFIDRLLRGAKPADLPFEQPRTFELIVNVKAARALGIAVAPGILQAATRVIQ
jgi:putative ABC transport system substrate-binding protein